MFDLEKEIDNLRNIADQVETDHYFYTEDKLKEKMDINNPFPWIQDRINISEREGNIEINIIIIKIIYGTMFDLIENFENFKNNHRMMEILGSSKLIKIMLNKMKDYEKHNLIFPEYKYQLLRDHLIKLEKL